MSVYVKNGWVSMPLEPENQMPDGEYMTIREYAENEGKSIDAIRNWVKRDQIECYILNQAWVIPVGVGRKKVKMT